MFRKPPEVLVIGGGPVGLFAGLHVASRGHRVRIIDKEWRPTAHSYALALHGESLSLLDEVGLLGPVLRDSRRIRRIGFFEGSDRFAELDLNRLPTDFSFVAVLRQDQLEKRLADALSDRGVRVSWNHELSQVDAREDGLEVTVDKLVREGVGYAVEHGEWVVAKSSSYRPEFLIGADGHQSRVRRAMGIDYPVAGGTRSFAVFEFRTDADLGDEMRIFTADGLLNVVWPLPDGFCRWSFEVTDEEASEISRVKERTDIQLGGVRYPSLSDSALTEMMAARAPWFNGSVTDIRWRLLVRFERHLAERFGEGRVWLAGDSAHMTGPVGIQSMNVGLREARSLAHRICDVLDGRLEASAMAGYNLERQQEWGFLLGTDHSALAAGASVDPRMAALAGDLVSCLPASGNGIRELVKQAGFEIVESAVV